CFFGCAFRVRFRGVCGSFRFRSSCFGRGGIFRRRSFVRHGGGSFRCSSGFGSRFRCGRSRGFGGFVRAFFVCRAVTQTELCEQVGVHVAKLRRGLGTRVRGSVRVVVVDTVAAASSAASATAASAPCRCTTGCGAGTELAGRVGQEAAAAQ